MLTPQGSNLLVLSMSSAQSRYWQIDGAVLLRAELKNSKTISNVFKNSHVSFLHFGTLHC